MFEKKKVIKTKLEGYEILNVISENICTHSPVLNAKDINMLKTDRVFCGKIEKESFLLWEILKKRAVLVPVAKGELADYGEEREIILNIKLPYYNELMLKVWFILLLLFVVGNLCYLPFNINKLYSMINFISAALVFFCSFIFIKRLTKKRTEKLCDKIGEIIKC